MSSPYGSPNPNNLAQANNNPIYAAPGGEGTRSYNVGADASGGLIIPPPLGQPFPSTDLNFAGWYPFATLPANQYRWRLLIRLFNQIFGGVLVVLDDGTAGFGPNPQTLANASAFPLCSDLPAGGASATYPVAPSSFTDMYFKGRVQLYCAPPSPASAARGVNGTANTNTGNGTVTGLTVGGAVLLAQCPIYSAPPGYIARNIGVTFTSATAFTVTGPGIPANTTGTVGTPFSAGGLAFTITAGGTAFVAGDGFAITFSPVPWVLLRED